MRRGYANVVRDRELEGSERSAELATALAQTCDPEFLEALVHAKALIDAVGGQVFIAGVRNKYEVKTVRDAAGNILGESKQLLDDHSLPGEYATDAYLFHYEHIATALRGARKQPDDARPAEPREEEWVERTEPVSIDIDEQPSTPLTDEELEMHFPVEEIADEGFDEEAEIKADIAAQAAEPEPVTVPDDSPPPNIVQKESAELRRKGKSGDAFGG